MGVLPLNFKNAADYDAATADHAATFSLTGLNNDLKPRQEVTLTVKKSLIRIWMCASITTHVWRK